MRFIVVGPDGSGKTTFSKWFAEKYGLEYVGCTYRESNKFIRTIKLLNKDNIVYDRLYLPDHLVYSRLKNKKLSPEELGAWVGLMNYLKYFGNVIILYVDAPDEVLKERLNIRGDEYIEFEEIKEIRKIYRKVLPELEVPIVRIESADGEYRIKGFDI
jgi:adenylate kinase family enzyme